jgi:glycosyltransferase involved in cell wall biosynthesis
MNDFCSIVMISFRKGVNNRNSLFLQSLNSLLTTDAGYSFEFYLIDNTQNNRGLAGRNEGFKLSTGKYLCYVDDDILFKENWLKDCVDILESVEGKYTVTPIHTPIMAHKKFELPPVNGYRCNYRSGSNCMVLRKEAFADVGEFYGLYMDRKRKGPMFVGIGKSGTKYCDRQTRAGYKVLMTKEEKAVDLGFKKHAYDWSEK